MSSTTVLLLLFLLRHLYSAAGDTNFIEKTCKTTKYFDICISSLKSNPASQTAADAKSLAMIVIAAGVANSTATSAYLSSKLPRTTAAEPNYLNAQAGVALKKVLKDCADEYGFAADALRSSAQDLAAESFDYAYVHVSAAAEYPNSCRNAFRRYSLAYPTELARREDGLKRICEVVLGIIDNIGW